VAAFLGASVFYQLQQCLGRFSGGGGILARDQQSVSLHMNTQPNLMAAVRRSALRGAKSTGQIDDQTYQQYKTQPTSADDGTAKIKSTAAEKKHQHHHK
jgi:hypothetical protein